MTNNAPDYENNLYFENNKIQATGIDSNKIQANLTEQWKKGELPKGEEYWVILTDEWYLQNPVKPVRAFYSCDCEFEGYLDDDIQQVLAPVPSYEEFERLNNIATIATDGGISILRFIRNVNKENTQLKETISILKNKLIQCKPELEEWVNKVVKELESDV